MIRIAATGPVAVVAALLAIAAGCTPSAPTPGAPSPDAFAFDDTMRTTAAARSDVDAMLDALARIQGWHARGGRGVVQRLRAGSTLAQLDAVEAELGCKLPDEARALWRWRDGLADAGDGEPLVWYHDVLPLEQALAEYRLLRAEDWADWDAAWFPVLYVQEEWYFVECRPERTAASPVGFYFTESGAQLAYANLTAYFATAAEALQSGAAAAADAQGDYDTAAIAAIHARHNPGIPFPYAEP